MKHPLPTESITIVHPRVPNHAPNLLRSVDIITGSPKELLEKGANSPVGTMKQPVNLRSVLFHSANSEAGDGEQFRRRRGTIGGHGFQRLVAEDAEGGNSAALCFG